MTETKDDTSTSPMILNVCAAGDGKSDFDRTLVRKLAEPIHFLNDANYAVGNELMLRKLVAEDRGNSDGTRFHIPILTTHPGFVHTDILKDQGFLVDIMVPFLCHFVGTSELEAGRREVSKICAMVKKQDRKMLSLVDN